MRTIEEIDADRKALDEEEKVIIQKNHAPWQALIIERHGGHVDPQYPKGVRLGGTVLYCSDNFVSIDCSANERGIEILKTFAEIIRRRLDGEDI